VLFGSDYPHPEGLANPLDFAEALVGLTDAEIRAIMSENSSRLLGGVFDGATAGTVVS
jgi:predicted TIM-barrel fold metal-dependent hydrolase